LNLAPIALSTYKRKEHLAATLSALAKNTLARESELFIFSDAPRPGDEQAVKVIRQMIKSVTGFKKVWVVQRETNDRVANNRGGMKFLLQEYGKMIFLEEDVVTAPAFLNFVNEGLIETKDSKEVFSICGYTPPVQLDTFTNGNVFACKRFSAWGFGMWSDRFERVELGQIDPNFLSVNQMWRLRSAGTDLRLLVNSMAKGELEALDVRVNFTMAREDLLVLCPTKSLVVNRGHDGTGTHCDKTDYYETEIDDRTTVRWDFANAESNGKIDRVLFFYRGRHRVSGSNLVRYHTTRKLTFGK